MNAIRKLTVTDMRAGDPLPGSPNLVHDSPRLEVKIELHEGGPLITSLDCIDGLAEEAKRQARNLLNLQEAKDRLARLDAAVRKAQGEGS